MLQLVVGRDGQVRGAELKAISKGGQQTKMVPFKIVEAEHAEFTAIPKRRQKNSVIPGNASDKAEDEPSIKRTPRKAAIEGQNLRTRREQFY